MARPKVEEEIPDRIAETFKGQNILITGGTGFLGKVIIERFLRCLPNTEQIYMLIRTKKEKDPKRRLEEIFNSPVNISNKYLLLEFFVRMFNLNWLNF